MRKIEKPSRAKHEIESARTYYSKTFDCGGGVKTVIAKTKPVHFLDNQGFLQDIDCTLVASGNSICPKGTSYSFKLNESGIGYNYISRKSGPVNISLDKVADSNIGEKYIYTYTDNKITFANVEQDLDITFELLHNGIKTTRVLKSEFAPKDFTWIIKHNDKSKDLVSNDIFGKDAENKKLHLTTNINNQSDGYVIQELWDGLVRQRNQDRIPYWGSGASYPVSIDPFVVEIGENSGDITEIGNATINPNSLYLGMGDYWHVGCRFPNVPLSHGVTVTSGSLVLHVIDDGQGNSGYYASGLLYGYDVDSAAKWSDTIRPSNSAKTSAKTIVPRASGTGFVYYNITAIMQEIFDRPGWLQSNALSLFILNQEVAPSNATFFEDFSAAGNDEPFIEYEYIDVSGGASLASGNMPLFIGGHIPDSGSMTLYTQAAEFASGNMTLFIEGSGFGSLDGSLDLFTMSANFDSGNMPLYLSGIGFLSGTLDLFIGGLDIASGDMTLYTQSANFASGDMPLFIEGFIISSGGMNLFLKGETGTMRSGNMPLFTWSTTDSGIFSILNLFLQNNESFDPRQAMNLTIFGPASLDATSNMNLVLYNTENQVYGVLDLFIQNSFTEIGSGLNLFLEAPSGDLGAVPVSGSMNLFINREFEGVYSSIPLFLSVANESSGDMPLYIFGANFDSGNMPLFIQGIGSATSDGLILYSHGI